MSEGCVCVLRLYCGVVCEWMVWCVSGGCGSVCFVSEICGV